jgi:S-adenosylmethionine hydrolase
MPGPISLITLLTDFGDRDYFVACMKGVILSINPQARIVDLCHHIAPQNIDDAAYVLNAAYRYFPDGAVHVAVVDPGVGSRRRPLLVSTSRCFFLAPDNGLLSRVMREERSAEVRHIENKQYRLDSEGATFDGRDLFAPAAAWLTRGQAPGSYGRLIRDAVILPWPEPTWEGDRMVGRIDYVDRFGNLISNIATGHLKEWQGKARKSPSEATVRIGGVEINGLARSYADGNVQGPEALVNSNGFVEIFVKNGDAADLLKCARGARIELVGI